MKVYKSFKLRYEVCCNQGEELVGIASRLAELIKTGESLKFDKAASVSKVRVCNQDLIIKRFTGRSRWHSVKRLLRRSRANNAWKASQAYSTAGIGVPEAKMYLERRLGPLRFDSYFVYQALEGEPLLEVLPNAEGAERRALIAQLADLFRKLRANHLVHGDMKATNLMVVKGKIFAIDLDVAGTCKFHFEKAHARDQKRFLKNWIDNEALTTELSQHISV